MAYEIMTPEKRKEVVKLMGERWALLFDIAPHAKACPFCGEDANVYLAIGGYGIECNNRECHIRPSHVHSKSDVVLKQWNRRA